MTATEFSRPDPQRFQEGLDWWIDEVYRRDLAEDLVDSRAEYPWVTGYLGDPFAPVWFVAEAPSLKQVEAITDPDPTPDLQWTMTKGDALFRKCLYEHGFKEDSAFSPGGWRCYITDVIKAAATVKDVRELPRARFTAAAEAWSPVLKWELQNGLPRLVVSVGKTADSVLSHLIETGQIPAIPNRMCIPHYVYVASRPDNKRNLPGNALIRQAEYHKQFEEIAQHPALATVTLRVTDGREVDLGPREVFERAFRGIVDATGGSSGGGQWSFLFGFVPALDVLGPETADRVAEEAKDFTLNLHGHLAVATEQLLDRIASLADRQP
jgi:hypothetical protein